MGEGSAFELKGFPRRVAVLGSGQMGSQIAAHLVNAGVEVVLFGLPAAAPDYNAGTRQAIERLHDIRPAPLTLARHASCIVAANYHQHLDKLRSCDLIIEAISENFDDKEGFYVRIAPYIDRRAIITSSTSRVSIDRLARALPEALRLRFCGMHFFNPPRYRHLVELIPNRHTDARVLNRLETFLVGILGKDVVRARDTPYFIAGRIGLMALSCAVQHAERFTLAPDLADTLCRTAFGLEREAPFAEIGRIGHQTFCSMVGSLSRAAPDDPWFAGVQLPSWLHQHSGDNNEHAGPSAPVIAASVLSGLQLEDFADRFIAMRSTCHPQAQFLWSVLRDVLHYSAFWLEDIAETAADIDLAVRWGFDWPQGPFELWQAIGWQLVRQWIEEDRRAHKTLTDVPLPGWVTAISAVYCAKGAYAPSLHKHLHKHKERTALPVYQRHLYPPVPVYVSAQLPGTTVFASERSAERIRLWHDDDGHIAILSYQPDDRSADAPILIELDEAISIAEEKFQALILWQPPPARPPAPSFASNDLQTGSGPDRQNWPDTLRLLEQQAGERQRIYQRLRYLSIPVIGTACGAVAQLAFEMLLQCDRIVAELESRLGFARLADGLFPAHGGCTEVIRRAALDARNGDTASAVTCYFSNLMIHHTAANAHQARQWGLLTPADSIVCHPGELLYVAKLQAHAMIGAGYRPPMRSPLAVAGRTVARALINGRRPASLRAMNQDRQIQNAKIAEKLAYVLCGGDTEPCENADAGQLLCLEREAFTDLVGVLNNRSVILRH